MADDTFTDDNVQHGIDDSPTGDGEKGAALGAVGGAVVGALAGGPLGAVIGAVAGGVASGVGVAAVDRHDNDNNISGVGDGVRTDVDHPLGDAYSDRTVDTTYDDTTGQVRTYDNPVSAGINNFDNTVHSDVNNLEHGHLGNGVPGVQTGGYDADGTPDTRGITEKAADALTGDRIDDKTGKVV